MADDSISTMAVRTAADGKMVKRTATAYAPVLKAKALIPVLGILVLKYLAFTLGPGKLSTIIRVHVYSKRGGGLT